MTLGGNIVIRNGFRLDYCWKEAVRSLLPVCDEVVICDVDSDDGTRQAIDEWAAIEPKITIVNLPWTNPTANNQWWPTAINYARQHLSTEHHIQLDADEILHEEDYPKILEEARSGKTLFCHRLNFWKDHRHLIPEGVCCGTKVLKIAPANMPMPSDYPWEPAARTMANAVESSVRIFHYGFIRERKAFFRKAREVQRIWVDSYDPRLERAESYQGNWAEMPGVTGWEDNLLPYAGTHPMAINQWLKERGHVD